MVDAVQVRKPQLSEAQVQLSRTAQLVVRNRIQLPTTSGFDGASTRPTSTVRTDLPEFEGATETRSVLGSLSDEQRLVVQKGGAQVAGAVLSEIADNPSILNGAAPSEDLTIAITSARSEVGNIDFQGQSNELSTLFSTALSGVEKDLTNMANLVRERTILSGEMSTDITELRQAISEWPEGVDKQEFTWRDVTSDEDGNVTVVEQTKALTKDEAVALAEKLEGQKKTLSEITGMDQFDLQNMAHLWQQAQSILSAILADMNATGKAIIGNLRG